MLTIDQFRHRVTGELLAGFVVRNRLGKSLAIGASSAVGRSFVQMSAKRYAHDADLVAKVARLTGLTPRP